jgi:plastocyanin
MMNRKMTVAAGVAAILATAVIAFTTSQAAFAAEVNVDIVPGASTKTNDAFSPNPVQAKVGDEVKWTNKDTALHTVTSGSGGKTDGKFGLKPDGSPELIGPGKDFEFKPTAAGDYPYFCSLHPAMVGELKVSGGS